MKKPIKPDKPIEPIKYKVITEISHKTYVIDNLDFDILIEDAKKDSIELFLDLYNEKNCYKFLKSVDTWKFLSIRPFYGLGGDLSIVVKFIGGELIFENLNYQKEKKEYDKNLLKYETDLQIYDMDMAIYKKDRISKELIKKEMRLEKLEKEISELKIGR